jgi:tetratricopeptide (TPR) repeat protein
VPEDDAEAISAEADASPEKPAETTPSEAASDSSAPSPSASEGIFCNQCGWKNPADANFCSRCGTRLQTDVVASPPPGTRKAELPEEPEEAASQEPSTETAKPSSAVVADEVEANDDSDDEQKAVNRQVGIIVGAGALLVVVLFMISAISNQPSAPATSDAATATTTETTPDAPPAVNQEPLPEQLASRADDLRSQIEAATGAERETLLADLVRLLAGAGRLDLAAVEQQRLAELQNTAAAWRHAGNLYYDWMMTVDDQARRAQIAEQSIAAYSEVMAIEPGNLDARTDMAVAYLNTNNPMRGVEEITAVLDQDSTHVPARFNYGVMLAMIGRSAKAEEQFQLVQQIVDDPESPYYQRAADALQTMQEAPQGAPPSRP